MAKTILKYMKLFYIEYLQTSNCAAEVVFWLHSREYTVTRIDGKLHQPHRVPRTKQVGWWKIILTFAMDIFGFFQHFRCKFSTVSKFSDYVSFSKDGHPRLFVIFRLCFLLKGWKAPTFRNFPIVFPFQRMEIPNICDGHFRFFPRKLNSTDWTRSSDLCHTSLVLYRCAILLLFSIVINKINKNNKYFWPFFWSSV
jgi:hypothetical protein